MHKVSGKQTSCSALSCFSLIAISEQMVEHKSVNHRISCSRRTKHKLLSTTIQELWIRESQSRKQPCIPLKRITQNGERVRACVSNTKSVSFVWGNAQLCGFLLELSGTMTLKKSPMKTRKSKSGFVKRETKRRVSENG